MNSAFNSKREDFLLISLLIVLWKLFVVLWFTTCENVVWHIFRHFVKKYQIFFFGILLTGSTVKQLKSDMREETNKQYWNANFIKKNQQNWMFFLLCNKEKMLCTTIEQRPVKLDLVTSFFESKRKRNINKGSNRIYV